MKRSLCKKLLGMLIACFMVISVTACGGQSASEGTTSSSEEAAQESASEQIDTDATLVYAMYSIVNEFDPQKSTSYGVWNIANQIYDTLVVTDYDGKTIKAGLATSWEISDDGLTYTFYLRDDVYFHSGKQMTSADVKYSFERMIDPETASPAKDYLASLDYVECPDDFTAVLHLTQPDNDQLINLTVVCCAILNGEVVEEAGDEYGVTVVDGTGPYKFKEYQQDYCCVLERNDDYAWAPEIYENRGAAYFKEITIRYITEAGTRLMELESGSVDMLGKGGVLASELETLGDEYCVYEYEVNYPVMVQFQLDNVPDKALRQAMNYAINREELIDVVFEGHATPMYGGLPSGMDEYWSGCEEINAFDQDKARAVLNEAGYVLESDGYYYKDGEIAGCTIWHCQSSEDELACLTLQAQLAEVGIQLVIDDSATASFWSIINDCSFDSMVMSLFILNPDNTLGKYMNSANAPAPNRQGISDAQVDEWINDAKTTLDEEQRAADYVELQKYAVEEAIWIPLYSPNGWIVANNTVKGFTANPTCVEGIPKLIDCYKTK